MKKYFPLLLLTILIVPSITFASWWNPFTWFSRPTIEKTSVSENKPDSTILNPGSKTDQKPKNNTAPSTPINSQKDLDVVVPMNASLSSYGGYWNCNNGYKTKYDNNFNKIGCEKIIIPANASPSSYDGDWYCNSGYKTKYDSNSNKVGCEKIIIPANASLSSYEDNWYCNSGYKQVGNNCEPESIQNSGNINNNQNNEVKIKYSIMNYFDINKTCVGLNSADFADCISYAYNPQLNWIPY